MDILERNYLRATNSYNKILRLNILTLLESFITKNSRNMDLKKMESFYKEGYITEFIKFKLASLNPTNLISFITCTLPLQTNDKQNEFISTLTKLEEKRVSILNKKKNLKYFAKESEFYEDFKHHEQKHKKKFQDMPKELKEIYVDLQTYACWKVQYEIYSIKEKGVMKKAVAKEKKEKNTFLLVSDNLKDKQRIEIATKITMYDSVKNIYDNYVFRLIIDDIIIPLLRLFQIKNDNKQTEVLETNTELKDYFFYKLSSINVSPISRFFTKLQLGMSGKVDPQNNFLIDSIVYLEICALKNMGDKLSGELKEYAELKNKYSQSLSEDYKAVSCNNNAFSLYESLDEYANLRFLKILTIRPVINKTFMDGVNGVIKNVKRKGANIVGSAKNAYSNMNPLETLSNSTMGMMESMTNFMSRLFGGDDSDDSA